MTTSRDIVMVRWVAVALIVVATNAVLIQTVVPETSNLKNVIRAVVLVVTLFLLFTRRVAFPAWLLLLALASVITLLLTGNTDQLTLVFVLLFVPALWSIPERDLDRSALGASVYALLLVFALLAAGVTTNELRVSQTYLSADVRARFTFGTNGVPFFMNLVYGAAAFATYYAFRWRLRFRWVIAAAAVAGSWYLFTQTNGRGGFLAILLFCVLAAVMPFLAGRTATRALIALQPVVYLGVALWLGTAGDTPRMNALLSFRPMLYGAFLDTVTAWDVFTSTTVKFADVSTVDSSALHLLYGGGLLMYLAFCVLFAGAVQNLARRGMHLQIAFMSAAMIYGISESILLRVENIFILYVWYLVLRYGVDSPRGPETTGSLPDITNRTGRKGRSYRSEGAHVRSTVRAVGSSQVAGAPPTHRGHSGSTA